MSNPQGGSNVPTDADRAEIYSALFAQMVLQQSNLAMMLMGKIAMTRRRARRTACLAWLSPSSPNAQGKLSARPAACNNGTIDWGSKPF